MGKKTGSVLRVASFLLELVVVVVVAIGTLSSFFLWLEEVNMIVLRTFPLISRKDAIRYSFHKSYTEGNSCYFAIM